MDTTEDRNCFNRRELLLSTAGIIAPAFMAVRASAATKDRVTTMSSRFDLEQFIEDCSQATKETDAQAAVQEIIRRAMEHPDDVMAAVGEPNQGGIQTLYRSDDLTILNIVWSPLMQLMPHDHNMWASLGIYTGREDNILWERTTRSINANGAISLSRSDTAGLPEDVIHSVINPIGKFTGAIHVYGGDFFGIPRSEWEPGTLQETEWDLDKAIRLFRDSNERYLAWEETASQCE